MAKKTIGNNHNIRCPYCGGVNHYVCPHVSMETGKVYTFSKLCFACNKIVYYKAQYEIVINAYDYDPSQSRESRD